MRSGIRFKTHLFNEESFDAPNRIRLIKEMKEDIQEPHQSVNKGDRVDGRKFDISAESVRAFPYCPMDSLLFCL